MRQPEIKEAVLRGAVPLQLYRVVADHAPELRATIRHMQLTAVKRADTQLQHASKYTHRKHNIHPTTAARTIISSSTTNTRNLATSHTHGPMATARHLPYHRPERARPPPL